MPIYEDEKTAARRDAEKRRRTREQRVRRRKRRRLLQLLAIAIIIAGTCKFTSVLSHHLKTEDPKESAEPADETSVIPDKPEEPGKMPDILEPDLPQKEDLTDAEKMEIISTSTEYTEDLVTFAEKYEQVLDFVYSYPEKKDQHPAIDLTKEAAAQKPPLLIQWDDRWGYVPYGEGLIGYSGCGPVSLCMAALYLTGNPQYTPITVSKMAEEQGYCVPGNGSSWTLISEGCKNVGLSAKELPLAEGVMKRELDQDHPIIVVVGPGDFTFGGHFMLITGYTEDGFVINDPNSRENSKKHWSYEILSPQIRNLWAMSAVD